MTKPSVFVSYAREDVGPVRALSDFLKTCGLDVWLDEEQILPGEKWDNRIKTALRDADFVVLCLSPRSVSKRGYVQREARIALDASEEMLDTDIYLIPVLLEDCEIPTSLQDLQWVSFFTADGPQRLRRAFTEGAARRGLGSTPDLAPSSPQSSEAAAQQVDLSDLGGAGALSNFSLRKLIGRRRRDD